MIARRLEAFCAATHRRRLGGDEFTILLNELTLPKSPDGRRAYQPAFQRAVPDRRP
jgi:predicted signal transduction protein with EAL and GGDEF domain